MVNILGCVYKDAIKIKQTKQATTPDGLHKRKDARDIYSYYYEREGQGSQDEDTHRVQHGNMI